VGSTFQSRAELSTAGVHRPTQGGISGGHDGADSIVVSGGYVDDQDFGQQLIYASQGGRDPNTGAQSRTECSLVATPASRGSQLDGRPVRVARGAGVIPSTHRQSDTDTTVSSESWMTQWAQSSGTTLAMPSGSSASDRAMLLHQSNSTTTGDTMD
jgi:hypothetical protein